MTPWLIITLDPAAGTASVQGADAVRACELLAGPRAVRRWARGSGCTIATDIVADLVAFAEFRRELLVINKKRARR